MTDVKHEVRVYRRNGEVAHLMIPGGSPGYGDVFCGLQPWWGPRQPWYGTFTAGERDWAAALPLCKRCQKRATS